MTIIPKFQAIGNVYTTGVTSFTQWSKGIAQMSQSQLANLLIINNQKLGYDALNSAQMRRALIEAGLSKEVANSTVKQVLQTKATVTQTAATKGATVATGGFSAAVKGLALSLKSLIIAHPVIASLTVAFWGACPLYDSC